eukprot:s585_g12.t1
MKIQRLLSRGTPAASPVPQDELSGSEAGSLDIEEELHQRSLDPSDPDVYLDAFFGPLFFKLDRIRKEGSAKPRFSDYWLVSIFLLLNVGVQLTIALKIEQVGQETYGSIGKNLNHGTCWRISHHPDAIGALYPESLAGLRDSSTFDFDCTQPMLTLSIFPESLDTNRDGFWTMDEVMARQEQLASLGSNMAQGMNKTMQRMAKYDEKNRPGSRSVSTSPVKLDMEFFKFYKGKIQVCVANDKNLCGNLEASKQLPKMLGGDAFEDEDRVAECEDLMSTFCPKIFGSNYQWINYETSELCGEPEFDRVGHVNKVTYESVTTYQGDSDSILGHIFVTFLVLMLFVWIMLMLSEFRSIFNLVHVIWYMPSTSDSDASFASGDETFTVSKLPTFHKVFSLLFIALPRLVIAVVVLYVGANFLAITNNLQDLVLNSTALGFLIEVDNMIHSSLLGQSFEILVMHRFEAVSAPSRERGVEPVSPENDAPCSGLRWAEQELRTRGRLLYSASRSFTLRVQAVIAFAFRLLVWVRRR